METPLAIRHERRTKFTTGDLHVGSQSKRSPDTPRKVPGQGEDPGFPWVLAFVYGLLSGGGTSQCGRGRMVGRKEYLVKRHAQVDCTPTCTLLRLIRAWSPRTPPPQCGIPSHSERHRIAYACDTPPCNSRGNLRHTRSLPWPQNTSGLTYLDHTLHCASAGDTHAARSADQIEMPTSPQASTR